jgi:hypothetical protein
MKKFRSRSERMAGSSETEANQRRVVIKKVPGGGMPPG